MEPTPEGFAPYMARAIHEATLKAHIDPDGPMNALVAGLQVFRDLLVQSGQLGQPAQKEAIFPGYLLLKRAIASVMNGDLESAQEAFETYAREHPLGTFATAVTSAKVYPVMTLMVQPMTVTAFCRRCLENTTFERSEDGVATCQNCGNVTFIIRHK